MKQGNLNETKWAFQTVIKALESSDSHFLSKTPEIYDVVERLTDLVREKSMPEDWPTANDIYDERTAGTNDSKLWQKKLLAALLNHPNQDDWILLIQDEYVVIGTLDSRMPLVVKPIQGGLYYRTLNDEFELAKCSMDWEEDLANFAVDLNSEIDDLDSDVD